MPQIRQFLVLSPLLGLGLVQAAPQLSGTKDQAVIRVREVLDRPGFPLVRVAGVCDITADGAKCWDGQGKPFESLGQRITAYYLAQGSAGLSIRPGMKNRWVAIERDEHNLNTSHFFGGLNSGNMAGSIMNWRENMTLEWYRLDVLKEDKVASVQAKFRKEIPGAQVPLKNGGSAELKGIRFTVEEFGPIPRDGLTATAQYLAPLAKYRIRVKRQVLVAGHLRYEGPTLLDAEGNDIRQVDENGKPVAAGTWVQLSSNRRSQDEDEYVTNVNPRFVSGLKYGQSENQTVLFEQVPLDPISDSSKK